MQTYLVSILLRTITGRVGLLFYLIGISFCSFGANRISPDPIEKDSLFAQWAKSKSTLPTLFYELIDFNDFADRVEAESLIRMYGIGGVIVPNGNSDEVKTWIVNNRKWRSEPLLHIAAIHDIFELPFNESSNYPSQLSVECFTNDSLVYWLGQAHANDLREMGFGLIQIKELPAYYSQHEFKKVAKYLDGLNAGGIDYFLTKKPMAVFSKHSFFDQSKLRILDASQIKPDGVLDKTTLKKYRKETKEKRIVLGELANVETSVKQMERGVGIMTMHQSSKPQSFINAILIEGIPSKGYYRHQVRKYFGLLHQVEQVLQEPSDISTDWDQIKNLFKCRDVILTQHLNDLVPIGHLEGWKIHTISDQIAFEQHVDRYLTGIHWPLSSMIQGVDSLISKTSTDALFLIDLTTLSDLVLARAFCDSLSSHRSVVVFLEGEDKRMLAENLNATVIWNPDDSHSKLEILVEMAFGARSISGALPGYFQDDLSRRGLSSQSIGRLKYFQNDESKVDRQILSRIDTLIAQAIREEMMPGCQIMMVKDGQVVYDKNFGYLTYDSLTPVQWDHVYDIASVTKTVATVPALMHRMQQGKMTLSAHVGDYISNLDSTKAQLSVDDILTHQSGLKSYIPFWRNAKYFSDSASFLYKERKWRRKYSYHAINWGDSIQSWIARSSYNSLSNKDGTYRYLYSDLGFMLMKDLVEENCACDFDQSLDELIYRPLGMDYTFFNPLNKIPKEQIAPTEEDKYFRSELLQGIVHDKNAALLGGVSGHAGLFSNANDLAKYMQMLIQGGYYGGVRYFSDSVVQIFTSKKNENDRRAMGWDKPYQSVGNASKYASKQSFGHSGFTGTLIWADPKYNLVYIFLSNRIYPDPQNYKLIESNTRTKIHDLMYESFLNLEKESNPGS
ncbi:CubicO group peptidase, beta-lactamase class C family [Reichenbachiella faecimaris]|uniref:CubicO group peptidase, beta-lactamase class C family n=1 Tax=Reichenbachiella faecimaris TaxID=692418 RepID=A0A1W2G6U4_REIFA|nr:serine hydrolase [Reichenbachiella faecimaris]SMD32377.1 CubicO group peptidase, beta-lactamase class C family [Reichenbachiella faecimaris]